MRKDGTYGSGNEVEAFSKLCNIKITCYIRYISNNKKTNKDKLDKIIYNREGEDNNFTILLSDYGSEEEQTFHFEAITKKNNNNQISEEKLNEIKNKLLLKSENKSNNKRQNL